MAEEEHLGKDHPLYWDILKLEEGDILTLHVDYDAIEKLDYQRRVGYMARTQSIVTKAVKEAGKTNPVIIMPTTMKLQKLSEDELRRHGLCKIWEDKEDESGA